jgi:urease accessory protein
MNASVAAVAVSPLGLAPLPPVRLETAGPAGWRARLALGFARRGGRTALVRRSHQGPLVVQKPLYPEGEAVCHAILVHPPAGIAGGDELTVEVEVEAGAHALFTTPGAGKWYRSAGARSRLTQRIRVEAGGVCEWLPQEGIVYDRALGDLLSEVDLAADAVYLGMEMLCLGRTASGERFGAGELALATRIRREGRPLWLERGRLVGGSPLLASPAGLAGQPVTGTLLAAAPDLPRELLEACRDERPAVGEGAVSLLPGLLVARYLGPACEPGRAWMLALWRHLRPALIGRPAAVPRIWNT